MRRHRIPGRAGCLLLAAAWLAACGGAEPEADASRPDVVLVTWDTTRADHVGPDAAVPGLTPRWNRLATRGTRFAWARTPSPMTLPAHASLHTGRIPPEHGARANGLFTLPDASTTLAERLAALGWRTGAFVSAAVLDHRFGLAQGFEVYDDRVGAARGREFGERRADASVDAALAWIGAIPQDESVFLWLHLFDPHAPWAPPEDWLAAHPDDPYSGEIAYADAQTGRLLDGLERAGRLERTLLVITADHGESLGEHGERTHGYFAYDATARVPLLFWSGAHSGVEIAAGRRVDAPVLISDVAGTLLELLDLPPLFDGSPSLAPLLRQAPSTAPRRELALESVDPYFTFGTAPVFAVVDGDGEVWIDLPRRERYDPETDPGELRNLYEPSSKARADALFARHPRAWPPRAPDALLDAQREAQLAALGYLTSRGGAATAGGPRPDPKDLLPVAALWMGRDPADRPDRALAQAETLAQRFGPLPALAFFRADRLDELARPEQAIEVLRQAAVAHPEDTRLRDEIQARERRRAEDRALADRIRAVWQQQPDHPGALHDLAVVLHRLGQTEEAEALYRRWLATHPDDVATRLDLYRLLGARGAFDEALTLLREVRPGAKRSAALDCAEGRLLAWWMGRRDEARPALRACRDKGEALTPREVQLLDDGEPPQVQLLDDGAPPSG